MERTEVDQEKWKYCKEEILEEAKTYSKKMLKGIDRDSQDFALSEIRSKMKELLIARNTLKDQKADNWILHTDDIKLLNIINYCMWNERDLYSIDSFDIVKEIVDIRRHLVENLPACWNHTIKTEYGTILWNRELKAKWYESKMNKIYMVNESWENTLSDNIQEVFIK